MDDWAAQLPITSDGDSIGLDNVNTTESADGFGVAGSRDLPSGFDRDLIVETLTDAGFNMRVNRDDEEFWNATFFADAPQGRSTWTIDFTETEGRVGFQIGVIVDGSPWGLETVEDLWNSYQDDREAALRAQDERQQEAITKLQDLETALASMVTGQS